MFPPKLAVIVLQWNPHVLLGATYRSEGKLTGTLCNSENAQRSYKQIGAQLSICLECTDGQIKCLLVFPTLA